jgi:GNAT superfamily N-acetyltransferase
MMRLRPLRSSDIERLAWLPAVAAKAGYERWANDGALATARSSDHSSGGQASAWHVLCIDEAGPHGMVEYALDAPVPGAAQVRFLAVDPTHRRIGIGGRAALALERRLMRSVERIYVAVPARIGIALYFWLRLGYRPLTKTEWPADPEDPPSTWMVRELR